MNAEEVLQKFQEKETDEIYTTHYEEERLRKVNTHIMCAGGIDENRDKFTY